MTTRHYCFVRVALRWHDARWSPGITDLIMGDAGPACVSDAVVNEIRAREVRGVVELPRRELARGERVTVTHGPLRGLNGLYDGMRGHERVAILLGVLGRVVLLADDIAPV